MGIEYRNGRPYYYRKKRQGSKVIFKYAGSGELAQIIAVYDQEEAYEKEAKKHAQNKESARHRKMDLELVQMEK